MDFIAYSRELSLKYRRLLDPHRSFASIVGITDVTTDVKHRIFNINK